VLETAGLIGQKGNLGPAGRPAEVGLDGEVDVGGQVAGFPGFVTLSEGFVRRRVSVAGGDPSLRLGVTFLYEYMEIFTAVKVDGVGQTGAVGRVFGGEFPARSNGDRPGLVRGVQVQFVDFPPAGDVPGKCKMLPIRGNVKSTFAVNEGDAQQAFDVDHMCDAHG
jgi:hypothetical protein